MALSLTRFSWSLWGGGRKEKEPVSNGSAVKERGVVKFPLVKENNKMAPPPHRKVRRKRQDMEGTRFDREYDVVFVPSDGGGDWCILSGSDSDDSDWSIGWLEPLGSDFQSNDDESDDNSFAVLVPCYTPGCKEVEGSKNVLLSAIKNLSNEFSSAGKNYMEQWLASLQNFEA